MTAHAAPAQGAFAAALLDPALPCPAGLRARAGAAVARRFDVHRNNVIASLVDAVADTFPVVRALVGEAFFRAMAVAFVRSHPPRSPVLHAYGDAFPLFVAGFAPAAALPYLADVARLEWARMEACHAADAQPLTRAPAAGGRIGELLPVLHPATRLVRSPHAIVALWAAHQQDAAPEHLDASPAENALVVRPAHEVLVVRCDDGTAAFLRAAQEGRTLGECATAGLACAGFDLAACLSLLLVHGALAALHLPHGTAA
ncbi:MAG: DUF2063 domain-containing protein [Comamonadaceae bacterium]|nr:MAG: DUF2063 domain-containing protein [Comamonadaceae bacterium]